MVENYKKVVLQNGLRVLGLPIPNRAGVAVGIWLKVGSRDETNTQEGLTHLTEHLLFKGTESRTSKDIAMAFEQVGGSSDAYTSREETCFFAYLPAKEISLAFEVIGDQLLNSRIEEDALKKEIMVVIEEISELKDSPSETAQELFFKAVFGNHPLGKPILGNVSCMKKTTTKDVREFLSRHYVSGNGIVCATGNFDMDTLIELAEKYIELPEKETRTNRKPPSRFKGGKLHLVPRKTSQLNVILGGRLFPFSDNRRYAMAILNSILGRGPSSILFQQIREQKGLCYNIFSFNEFFQDSGIWGIYAGIEPTNAHKYLELLREILDDLMSVRIDEELLAKTISGISGKLLLEVDSVSGMLMRLAETELYEGRYITTKESIEELKKVSPDDIRKLANELFDPKNMSGIILGKTRKIADSGWLSIIENELA